MEALRKQKTMKFTRIFRKIFRWLRDMVIIIFCKKKMTGEQFKDPQEPTGTFMMIVDVNESKTAVYGLIRLR